jgi:hypothetical protein
MPLLTIHHHLGVVVIHAIFDDDLDATKSHHQLSQLPASFDTVALQQHDQHLVMLEPSDNGSNQQVNQLHGLLHFARTTADPIAIVLAAACT